MPGDSENYAQAAMKPDVLFEFKARTLGLNACILRNLPQVFVCGPSGNTDVFLEFLNGARIGRCRGLIRAQQRSFFLAKAAPLILVRKGRLRK